MSKRIARIQGRPERDGKRFGHALAAAYAQGAAEAGHDLETIRVAGMDVHE